MSILLSQFKFTLLVSCICSMSRLTSFAVESSDTRDKAPRTLPPKIISFSPTSGPVGTIVSIAGQNFHSTPDSNVVYFGATRANVTSASPALLTVQVPVGASASPPTVTTGGLTAFANAPFIVTFSSKRTITTTSFSPPVRFVAGTNPNVIAISDIDGDGKPDLAIGNTGSDTVSFLRNTTIDTTITFAPRVEYFTGTYSLSRAVAIGDLDGDCIRDVVHATYASTTLSAFRNISTPGTIALAPEVDYYAPAQCVVIDDIDVDGKPELLATNAGDDSVSILRNISTRGALTPASFEPKVDFPTSGFPLVFTVGDLNADGKKDVVIANLDSSLISIFENQSTPGSITSGSLGSRIDIPTALNPYGVVIGDVNQDGKPDLVVGNFGATSVSVFQNNSNGGAIIPGMFSPRVNFDCGYAPRNMTLADINGDGKLDIVTGNSDSTVSVLENTCAGGAISFGTHVEYVVDGVPTAVAVGDLDGDAAPEIVSGTGSGNSVAVCKNRMALVRATLKVSLEGPYNSATQVMRTTLALSGILSTHFASTPIPANAVDSITLELRNTALNPSVRRYEAAWLLSDGSIRCFSDTTKGYVEFDEPVGSYFLVVHHRNHISIMSSVPISLSDTTATVYDFTLSQDRAYGMNAMKPIGTTFVMHSGDANQSRIVTASDANDVFDLLNAAGYYKADINLSGIVTAADANMVFGNLNVGSQVP